MNKYKSKFEVTIAKDFTKFKLKFTYEPDVFVLFMDTPGKCGKCGHLSVQVKRRYTPDFKINGHYLETKGKFTSKDRSKILAFVKQYPNVSFRMLFMRDNKLNRTSKQTYSSWCNKHSIKYAVGTIPKAWIKELKCPPSP